MAETKYLTVCVYDRDAGDWEVMIEDIPLTFDGEPDFWSQMARWTAKRVQVYPIDAWQAWTLVTDQSGCWRRAFPEQNNVAPPPSSVRPRSIPSA